MWFSFLYLLHFYEQKKVEIFHWLLAQHLYRFVCEIRMAPRLPCSYLVEQWVSGECTFLITGGNNISHISRASLGVWLP